ncbi:MAG: hypothetical protein IKD66_07920 [Solobacterium sp.]|nr:hypothetical protein [Solobacterium sp.]
MKHLFRKNILIKSLGAAGLLLCLLSFGRGIPVHAEETPIEIVITAEDLKSIDNSRDSTVEIKNLIVTTTGLAVFGAQGTPGTEPRPQMSLIHGESAGVNTIHMKSLLGDLTKLEITTNGSCILGVDVNYNVPEGWSSGDQRLTWEGSASELVLDGYDYYPGIIADPVVSIKVTIQPHVEDSVLSAAGGISPWLSAAILIIAAIAAGAMYYRSKSAAGKPNDSGKQ